MIGRRDKTMVRRIAVTLDALQLSVAALDQAARLAQRLGAQLEGIFVEDIELLQLAELPFLREVRTASRSVEAINPVRMEQELRVLAHRAERLLGEQAARHNVSWTFRIWRGSIDSELLAAAMEADVLALTRLGAALVRCPVVPRGRNAIAVLFTGSEAALRALDTAAKLASDPQVDLNILLPGDPADRDRLQRQAAAQLGVQTGGQLPGVRFIDLPDASLAGLLEALADTNSAVLILERDQQLLQTPSLRQCLNRLDCPLLVVR
ncbi:MAG: hypothetical protein PVJ15_00990 [Gammaproteobacteria bacterium]